MIVSRSNKSSAIHPYDLSAEDFLWIGRLVRSAAEIEDLIWHYLTKVTDLTHGAAVVLLGRTPVSSKLLIARTFAMARGATHLAAHKDCFESAEFKSVMKCRNIVAHGTMLGKTDSGEIAFEVVETQGVDGNEVVVSVICYSTESLAWFARSAEKLVITIERRLKLQSLREKAREQVLAPHLKAQLSERKKAKPEPPPRT